MKNKVKHIFVISMILILPLFMLGRIIVEHINSIPEFVFSIYYFLVIASIFSALISFIVLVVLSVKSYYTKKNP
jgi:hypothetical protein